jgi:hypothetical protein
MGIDPSLDDVKGLQEGAIGIAVGLDAHLATVGVEGDTGSIELAEQQANQIAGGPGVPNSYAYLHAKAPSIRNVD